MTASTDRIEREILLKASRSRVWRALVNAEEFGRWFGVALDGKKFDDSRGRGKAVLLSLKEVIKGWAEGIPGMKVGGRRELVIPPKLAFGNVSPPPEVGPHETVIFVIELLGIG